jgi:hypothetical protein
MSFDYIIEKLENSIKPEIFWRIEKDNKNYDFYQNQLKSIDNAIAQLKEYDSNIVIIKNLQERVQYLENIINKNVNPLLKDFL